MRNIPNKYTTRLLRAEIDKAGFAGDYDFFYLPMDFENRANVGYGFLNFRSPEGAFRFAKCFDGRKLERFVNSLKIIRVTPARMQGYQQNCEHFAQWKHPNKGAWGPIFLSEPFGPRAATAGGVGTGRGRASDPPPRDD